MQHDFESKVFTEPWLWELLVSRFCYRILRLLTFHIYFDITQRPVTLHTFLQVITFRVSSHALGHYINLKAMALWAPGHKVLSQVGSLLAISDSCCKFCYYNWLFIKFRTYGTPCGFLTSFDYDITILQRHDRPFDCDIIMKKSVNRCDVGPFAEVNYN